MLLLSSFSIACGASPESTATLARSPASPPRVAETRSYDTPRWGLFTHVESYSAYGIGSAWACAPRSEISIAVTAEAEQIESVMDEREGRARVAMLARGLR